MDDMSLKITFGYEMSEKECRDILSGDGLSIESFSSREEAFEAAAIKKFNRGLGCEVEIL